jgi:hypothetical protein
MAAIEKRLLVPSRRRVLPEGGFSWIDRRLVRDGFLSGLTSPESLLYFFLAAVADQNGLSFYGDRRIAALLKLSETALEHARRELERKDLIRYRPPLYQVLSLPDAPARSLGEITLPPSRGTHPPLAPASQPSALGHVLRRMLDPPTEPAGGLPR